MTAKVAMHRCSSQLQRNAVLAVEGLLQWGRTCEASAADECGVCEAARSRAAASCSRKSLTAASACLARSSACG